MNNFDRTPFIDAGWNKEECEIAERICKEYDVSPQEIITEVNIRKRLDELGLPMFRLGV